jgi:FlaA1/EpsC-like NDP-sugar epimerase
MAWNSKSKVYIIGAGIAGISIANEIKSKGIFGRVIAFLDDDPEKIGKRINGIPIFGPIDDVIKIVNTSPDDEALIAIPSLTRDQLKRIFNILKAAKFARIQLLPRISQILEGNAHLIQMREINPEDILTRTPVQVGLKESLSYVRGKRVLITGAGGSIGSELSRQLLSGGAERLYLFGHGENSLYEIQRELKLLQEEGVGEKATIVPVLGELQDREYVFHIMKRLKSDIVFHCAAHKHVPILEENPIEAIKNNVFGTRNIVEASAASMVARFVLISTDKAVEPSSVYGASKLLAEEIVLAEQNNGSHYTIVRFGNVLGSRGSILPLFKEQIAKGGPVTVTHPDALRYFMTIPEAVSLVLKAGGLHSNDGEIFVLDMGEPQNIKEMAEKIILFYGYKPGEEIKIDYIGLRAGEKLTESLCARYETQEPTDFIKIHKIRRGRILGMDLSRLLSELHPICYAHENDDPLFRNRKALKNALAKSVPGFTVTENEPEY